MKKVEIKLEEVKLLIAEAACSEESIVLKRARALGMISSNIKTACTLAEVNNQLRNDSFDALLLDLNINKPHGLDTFQAIHGNYEHLPIIVVGTSEEQAVIRSAVRLGAQDFIFKNHIETVDLLMMISYAIDRNRMMVQLKAQAEFKSRFLAQMSHEIRTPMNGVIGLTDVLMHSENLSAEEREIVRTLSKCGKNLIDLISDILDITKLEAEKFELEATEFNLRQLVGDTLKLFSQTAADKAITLADLVDPNVPSLVECDNAHMGQILSNLVGNAIKFTSNGSVSIRVSSKQTEKRRCLLRVEVVDTGMGIPEDVREKLFSEYQQIAAASLVSDVRGTGLGLAICAGLIKRMGGRIGVESEVGKGSTFWFELELNHSDRVSERRFDFSRRRVVVVGLSEQRRSLVGEQLSLRGIESVCIDLNFALDHSTLWSLSKDFDVALLDTHGLQDEAVSQSLFKLRARCNRPEMPVLQLGGTLPQATLYEDLAKLLGEVGSQNRDQSVPRRDNLGLHVLVADDNDVNRRVAVKLLKLLGCTTLTAEDGAEAVEKLKSTEVDVVLMDCRMPVMNGIEATREIRKLPSEKARTRIFALTANSSRLEREACLNAGMDAFIPKPVTLDDLRSKLSPPTTSVEAETPSAFVSIGSLNLDQQQTLDKATLKTLQELEEPQDEESFLDDLINTFVSQAPAVIKSIGLGIETQDERRIEHYSHKLKGFSRNLGAMRLTTLCNEVENKAQVISKNREKSIAAAIEKEYLQAKKELIEDWKRPGA